jgi:glycosyltransferase involved in cell wall biosynthesis
LSARSSLVTANGPILERRLPDAPARRLRVVQVVTKLSAGAGGITLRGALALDPGRFSTTIVTAEGGSLIARAEEAGLQVIRMRHMAPNMSPLSDIRGLRELTHILAAGEFDLVHTHSSKAGGLGRIAARRAGVGAVVHSFHGFPFHEFQTAARRRAYLAVERRLARLTDYFLADGTVVAAEAVRLKIASPERITAIASPVDGGIPVVSESARRQARLLLGIPRDAKVVGTMARLDAQKAPLDMVKAIAALRRQDVHMIWLGDGELRAKAERLIARRGMGDRFRLLGERADVPALLPSFDVFAMSSLYEGLPCALVEAMTCGIPAVATAVNSVPEIVISGKTGLLARPRDPASLSGALEYMLDHPVEAARMADAARAHIGDRFRPERHGDDLMEIYEVALRGASRHDAPATAVSG